MLINIKEGHIKHIYNEAIDLSSIGDMQIKRASVVDPENNGMWSVDLSLSGGKKIEGFVKRSDALKYEIDYIEQNILGDS